MSVNYKNSLTLLIYCLIVLNIAEIMPGGRSFTVQVYVVIDFCECVVILSGRELKFVQGFFISVLALEIHFWIGKGWDHNNRFNPPLFCLSQANIWISNVTYPGLFYVQYFEPRGDCWSSNLVLYAYFNMFIACLINFQ
jgi:hypothetical protein